MKHVQSVFLVGLTTSTQAKSKVRLLLIVVTTYNSERLDDPSGKYCHFSKSHRVSPFLLKENAHLIPLMSVPLKYNLSADRYRFCQINYYDRPPSRRSKYNYQQSIKQPVVKMKVKQILLQDLFASLINCDVGSIRFLVNRKQV